MGLLRRIKDKFHIHDWETIESWDDYKATGLEPRSYRIIRCTKCGVKQKGFYSEIFWKWSWRDI